MPAFDEISDDDRVRGGAGRTPGTILFHRFGVHGIEPELGSRGDQGCDWRSHRQTPSCWPGCKSLSLYERQCMGSGDEPVPAIAENSRVPARVTAPRYPSCAK